MGGTSNLAKASGFALDISGTGKFKLSAYSCIFSRKSTCVWFLTYKILSMCQALEIRVGVKSFEDFDLRDLNFFSKDLKCFCKKGFWIWNSFKSFCF